MDILYDHLVVVAGHASFREGVTTVPDDVLHDRYWALQDFQKNEPSYYVEHIKAGVETAKQDPVSLLMYSGGRTRAESGKWSEAATYDAIARHYQYWSSEAEHAATRLADRTRIEGFARDSYENLAFSLYRFYQELGRYPTHVSMVGWAFKRERFEQHAQALGLRAFTYIGCNNPVNLADALEGEARTVAAFRDDPTGSSPPLLTKRLARDPFKQVIPYSGCPDPRLLTV